MCEFITGDKQCSFPTYKGGLCIGHYHDKRLGELFILMHPEIQEGIFKFGCDEIKLDGAPLTQSNTYIEAASTE